MIARRRAALACATWALAAWLGTGCAPAVPRPGRGDEGSAADSLEAARHSGGDDRIEIDEPTPRRLQPAGEQARLRADMAAVWGTRRLFDVRAGIGTLVNARVRTVDGASAGHLSLGSREGHLHVVGGRLLARAGERVLLGSIFGSLPPPRGGGVAPGFDVRPTGSLWYGSDGLAATARVHGWRCTVASLARDRPALLRRDATNWLAVVHDGTHTFGLATAEDAARRMAATAFARVASAGLLVSGEIAWFGRRAYGHLRVRARDGRVSARVFEMPSFSATTRAAVDLAATGRSVRGGALAARARVRAARVVAALVCGERREGPDRRVMRRLLLEVRTRWARRFACAGYLALIADDEVAIVAQPLVESPARDRERRAVGRIELRIDERRPVAHRLKIEISRRGDGTGGLVVGAGSRIRSGPLHIEWRVSGHVVDPGLRGYVSRPGVGPFEYVSAVYGEGSDASLRLRLNLRRGVRLEGVAVSAWRQPPRLYVGARVVL